MVAHPFTIHYDTDEEPRGMGTVAFDTLEIVDILRKNGWSEEQARGISLALQKSQEYADLATKQDIAKLYQEIQEFYHQLKESERITKQDITELGCKLKELEQSTKQDIALLSHETKEDINKLSHETKEDINKLRHETKEDINKLRHETKEDIGKLRHETKEDIANLRHEMKESASSLRQEMSSMKSELLKWGIGIAIPQMTLLVGILIKLIFFPGLH